MEKHEIVFEDLHGAPDMGTTVVDLDAEDAGKGITRVADEDQDDTKSRGRVVSDADADDPELDSAADDAEDRDEDERGTNALGADEADEDDGQYGKKVRARIERERKLRKKDQEQAAYWRGQAETAQGDLKKVRESASKETIDALVGQISATETELVNALEDGKSEDQVKIMSRLTDLKAKKILAETAAQVEVGDDNRQESGKVRPAGGPSTLAKNWMERQSDWYGKPGFERQSRIANRLDKEIFAEGYSVDDPQYFKELNRRLRKQAPEIFDDPGEHPRRERQRSPVASVDGAGPTNRGRNSNKVELGSEDFANMRRFGLDPNNKEALLEYARSKREADQQEASRSNGRGNR